MGHMQRIAFRLKTGKGSKDAIIPQNENAPALFRDIRNRNVNDL